MKNKVPNSGKESVVGFRDFNANIENSLNHQKDLDANIDEKL